MAADIRADTGPGASGWARGSHTCSGTMPAFEPNPTTASTKALLRTQAGRCADLRGDDGERLAPGRVASSTRPTSNAAAPNWVITAYHWPAGCTSDAARWSTRTSRSDVTAISSHRNKNVVTLDAAGTSSRVVTKSGQDARRGPAGESVTVVAEAKDHGADPDARADGDEERAEAIEHEGEAEKRQQRRSVHDGHVTGGEYVGGHDESTDAGSDGEGDRQAAS